MELLKGESLADRLDRQQRLEPPLAIEITAQGLDALAEAHNAGIVHRDIKPENIFLCPPNDPKAPRGAAARQDPRLRHLQVLAEGKPLHLTQTGTVLGTPYYMSPEHARGAKDLNAQTDIWAMGVVLFECLTGNLPFEGDSYNEVMARILGEPVPLLREVRPTMSRRLERVVAQALAKDRSHRYESASDFRKDLINLDQLTSTTSRNLSAEIAITFGPIRNKLSRGAWLTLVASSIVLLGVITGIAAVSSDTTDQPAGDSTLASTAEASPTKTIAPVERDAGASAATTGDGRPSDGDAVVEEEASDGRIAVAIRLTPEVEEAQVLVNEELLDASAARLTPDEEHTIKVIATGYRTVELHKRFTEDATVEVPMIRHRASTRTQRRTRPRAGEPSRQKRGGSRQLSIVEDYPE